MKYKYKLNFFRNYDVIGFDEYVNDMYQQGWLIDDLYGVFVRFKKVDEVKGYLHYNNITAKEDMALTEKCLEYGFIEFGKHTYLGDSQLNLEKIQEWKLEKEASKSYFWLVCGVCIAILIIIACLSRKPIVFNLFNVISGYAEYTIYYIIFVMLSSIILSIQQIIYRYQLKQKVLNGDNFERASFEFGNKVLLFINYLCILIFIIISSLTYYPFLHLCGGLLLFFVALIICMNLNSNVGLKVLEWFLMAFIIFAYDGGFASSIEYDYSNLCVVEERCHTLNKTVKNVFYDLSMRYVRTSLWFDYYNANFNTVRDYTVNYHVKKYSMYEITSLEINADIVYFNDEGQYLVVKDNQVFFVYFIKDEYSIEDLNAIL